jgi:hypothetical protein
LTWTSANQRAQVAGVLDLGLANRTVAIHDLALALERSAIDWLDLADTGEINADLDTVDALLDGYESVKSVNSVTNTALAYDGYLIGHARWFEQARGAELIGHLQRRWGDTGLTPRQPKATVN